MSIRKRTFQTCIGGYAGCGNLGDDAILLGYLQQIEPAYDTRRIVVLSGRPRMDTRRFGVKCVNRKNPLAILSALLRSERFLCGGGSLLQNTTGMLSLFYYLSLLLLAKLCGCRVSLLASGIGPLKGRLSQDVTAFVLNRLHSVQLRDGDSYRLLLSMGVRRELLSIAPDPALFLPSPPPSRLPYLKKEARLAQSEGYVCVVLRAPEASASTTLQKITGALRILCEQHKLSIVYLLFSPALDKPTTERLQKKLGGRIARLREPADALAWLEGCELLLAMRLHALVLSVLANTPALGISASLHEQKLDSFCRAAGIPHLYAQDTSIVSLTHELEQLLLNRQKIRARLPSIAEELRCENA